MEQFKLNESNFHNFGGVLTEILNNSSASQDYEHLNLFLQDNPINKPQIFFGCQLFFDHDQYPTCGYYFSTSHQNSPTTYKLYIEASRDGTLKQKFNQKSSQIIKKNGAIISWTLLQFAAANGKWNSFLHLVSNGADPSITDATGRSAIEIADLFGHAFEQKVLHHHFGHLSLNNAIMVMALNDSNIPVHLILLYLFPKNKNVDMNEYKSEVVLLWRDFIYSGVLDLNISMVKLAKLFDLSICQNFKELTAEIYNRICFLSDSKEMLEYFAPVLKKFLSHPNLSESMSETVALFYKTLLVHYHTRLNAEKDPWKLEDISDPMIRNLIKIGLSLHNNFKDMDNPRDLITRIDIPFSSKALSPYDDFLMTKKSHFLASGEGSDITLCTKDGVKFDVHKPVITLLPMFARFDHHQSIFDYKVDVTSSALRVLLELIYKRVYSLENASLETLFEVYHLFLRNDLNFGLWRIVERLHQILQDLEISSRNLQQIMVFFVENVGEDVILFDLLDEKIFTCESNEIKSIWSKHNGGGSTHDDDIHSDDDIMIHRFAKKTTRDSFDHHGIDLSSSARKRKKEDLSPHPRPQIQSQSPEPFPILDENDLRDLLFEEDE